MKKLLAATALLLSGTVGASAADMAVKARSPAPMAAVYNWTGFYIGGNIGYGWGQNTDPFVSFVDPGGAVGFGGYFAAGGNMFPNLRPDGVIGGGQIGYNWQINQFVLGAVADFQGSSIGSSVTAVAGPPIVGVTSFQTLSERLDFLGTVRGKAGVAFNNVMLYGTGGYAYGRVKSSMTFDVGAPAFFTGTSTEWRSGWAAGVGGEYGIGPWSFGVEYLHYDLGRSSVTALPAPPGGAFPGASLTATQRTAGDIVRATFNYRFGAGAVVAKY
ncbi:porin family protein [Bradyrhizobium sp. LjRoot220]|uniref:outer membrane protein n=1 Tax=Bradyrhizobium sp. LjRoot220 TaxID=3342284 RepID=UPI003ECD8143